MRSRVYYIPVDSVSVNKAYITRTFSNKSGRAFSERKLDPKIKYGNQKQIKDTMRGYDDTVYGGPPVYETYATRYIFLLPRETMVSKEKKLKKVDVTNLIKIAEDAVFEYLSERDGDLDDRLVMNCDAIKMVTPRDRPSGFLLDLVEGDILPPYAERKSIYDVALNNDIKLLRGLLA